MCGKLEHWLYGFRKAASEWERFYASKLQEAGCVRGSGCPVLFYHSLRDVAMAVHGEDLWASGLTKTPVGGKLRQEWLRGQSARRTG